MTAAIILASQRWLLAIAFITALLAVALLSVLDRQADAAFVSSPVVTPNVVQSGGNVSFTFSAEEDMPVDSTEGWVSIFAGSSSVTSIAELKCTTSTGAECKNAPSDCSVVNEICRRYIVAAAGIEDDIDEDEQPGTFTAEFVLTITCDEVRFVDLQAETTFEFQFEDRVEAAVLCVPVDTQEEGNLTISKTYGAQTQAFSYQLDTQDPQGCLARIGGGPLERVEDLGTFTITPTVDPERGAHLYCGLGDVSIRELQGPGWVFVNAVCNAEGPPGPSGPPGSSGPPGPSGLAGLALQPVSGSTQTVTVERGFQDLTRYHCSFENAPDEPAIPDLTIHKACLGAADPDSEFTVEVFGPVDIDRTDSVRCGESLYYPDLDEGQYAIQEVITGTGANGVFTRIDCGDAGRTNTARITVTVPTAQANVRDIECTITNNFGGVDDPGLPNLSATKVCVGASGGTFTLSVADETRAVPCGATVTAVDVDSTSPRVSEAASGAFVTIIVCSDGTLVPRPSATVAIPEADPGNVACVVINVFNESGDGGGDVGGDVEGDGIPDIIAIPVSIEIDNANTNIIGTDNGNENNNSNANTNENENRNTNDNQNQNVNTNTQNQESKQDQNNENNQTNNIDASPEVDIESGR